MGNYRKDAAGNVHILTQRREMQQIKNQFANHADFIAHLKANPMPGTLKLRVKHLTQQPNDWNYELFGDFPKDGLLAVYCRLPSSNKSATNSRNDKHTAIFFSNQPNTKLNLKFELKGVFGWYCFSTSADTCIRFVYHYLNRYVCLFVRFYFQMKLYSLYNLPKNLLVSINL